MSGLSKRVPRLGGLSSIFVLVCVLAVTLVACGGDSTTGDTASTGPTVVGESVTSMAGVETAETTATTEAATETTEVTGSGGGSLVGKWYSEQTGETHEYTADGRMIVTSGDGLVTEMNYITEGGSISYLIGGVVVYTGTYAVEGDVLTQVDPDIAGTVFFDRVE